MSNIFSKKTEKNLTGTKEYKNLYLKETNLISRSGKSVNIRKEYHRIIQKLIQVAGGNTVSISEYLDNILRNHFDENKEVIQKLYEEACPKDIFGQDK
ncbi:MAG TPA: DUF3408 domain-containing protein [Dysgonomonas sp.]|uniref:DUF3408 domain-containing protein n=1 Tax=unclassified Dysgonomonas TaxID=2630389 RepID=UPI0025BEF685|nr:MULTISPECIES: DUF3408 domain-containing protein [unclassified Dysgonomonas]HML66562.1 DUF3408 domain-containing protein [Dysgonomonas sp.]